MLISKLLNKLLTWLYWHKLTWSELRNCYWYPGNCVNLYNNSAQNWELNHLEIVHSHKNHLGIIKWICNITYIIYVILICVYLNNYNYNINNYNINHNEETNYVKDHLQRTTVSINTGKGKSYCVYGTFMVKKYCF